ncbi:unnamed protein product [Ambrosiozyma monospora]|uniref:Unnamed protein product n=1 Tax=Ambrosiozyma monospora TaxID=43982 RepID=A0ACB5T4T1_AMBMO|nr:unnamed protein product [Ambrosiozyma monospora]
MSKKDRTRFEYELRELTDIAESMIGDELKHRKNHELTLDRLSQEKDTWFVDSSKKDSDGDEDMDGVDENSEEKGATDTGGERIKQILEFCLLPRLTHSSFDAVYCVKFIFLAHKINTPCFSLLYLLNELFAGGFLLSTLFTNTALETENLGIFYQQVLELLNHWRKNESVYRKEALGEEEDLMAGILGSNEKEADFEPKEAKLYGMKLPDGKQLGYEAFRKSLYNWHKSLMKQLMASLDSTHYTTRNNAIIFTKNLLGSFPVIEDQGDLLRRKLSIIGKKDEREDIKLASNALIGLISSNRSNFIPMWDFYQMDANEKEMLIKKKAERQEAERKRLAELEKARLDAEVKERAERVKRATATNAKAYGLTGLNNLQHKRPTVSSGAATTSAKTSTAGSATTITAKTSTAGSAATNSAKTSASSAASSSATKSRSSAAEDKKETTKPDPATKPSSAPVSTKPTGPSSTKKATSNSSPVKMSLASADQTKSNNTSPAKPPSSREALRARLEEEKRLLKLKQQSSAGSKNNSREQTPELKFSSALPPSRPASSPATTKSSLSSLSFSSASKPSQPSSNTTLTRPRSTADRTTYTPARGSNES